MLCVRGVIGHPKRKDTATIRGRRDTTNDDIGHLAERLVCEIRRLLMFPRLETGEDEFIGLLRSLSIRAAPLVHVDCGDP